MKIFKNISLLLVVLLIIMQPITVFADAMTVDFFNSPTCSHCQNVKDIFSRLNNNIENFSENVKINTYNIQDKENKDLLLEYYKKYSVPEKKQGSVPVVFIGDSYIIGDTDFENKFFKLYNEYITDPVKYKSTMEKMDLPENKDKITFVLTQNRKIFLYVVGFTLLPLLLYFFIVDKKSKEQE